LADATVCPNHNHIRRLGIGDDKRLERLHQEYHRTMAAMGERLISSSSNGDWSDVDQAEKALEQAIIDAYWNKKMQDGGTLVCEIEKET
jgi:hypothetical protein